MSNPFLNFFKSKSKKSQEKLSGAGTGKPAGSGPASGRSSGGKFPMVDVTDPGMQQRNSADLYGSIDKKPSAKEAEVSIPADLWVSCERGKECLP